MSLTVEAAKDESRLAEYARKSLRHSATLLVPIVLVVVLCSGYILAIFGHEYSEEGDALLRYLALSALPYAVVSLYVSIARVQRKVLHIVAVLSLLCVMAIGLILLWIEQYGLVSIGWAWLLSQSVVAGLLLLTGLRRLLFGSLLAGEMGKNAAEI
jgi:O-antigen/teichoic acid export membrane protein